VILSNCTKEDIDKALAEVNREYDNNVRLNNYAQLSRTGLRHRVTLRVLNSHGSGAHLSRSMEAFGRKARHTTSACWHVHGAFFDALPYGTRIFSRGKVRMAGDMWDDMNIGSIMYPVYASESCECGS
jgi:hypothetical protein